MATSETIQNHSISCNTMICMNFDWDVCGEKQVTMFCSCRTIVIYFSVNLIVLFVRIIVIDNLCIFSAFGEITFTFDETHVRNMQKSCCNQMLRCIFLLAVSSVDRCICKKRILCLTIFNTIASSARMQALRVWHDFIQ